jgi:hypothetical protein
MEYSSCKSLVKYWTIGVFPDPPTDKFPTEIDLPGILNDFRIPTSNKTFLVCVMSQYKIVKGSRAIFLMLKDTLY